jgi:lipid A 4'-phosphatase
MQPNPFRDRTVLIELIVPLSVMIIGTVICRITDLDIALSRLFFDPERGDFRELDDSIIGLSYHWGPVFSALAAFWALIHFFGSYIHPRFWAKRAVSAFILLCILIGPVLVVNGIVKESWRRPRPRDVVEFGGNHPFRQVLEFGNREYRGMSFPGGHASAGFILVMFYFLWKEKRRRLAWLALWFGLGWGIWLSYVRIVLGGHFFSDNLYSFGINWFVVWGLYYGWYRRYREKRREAVPFEPSRRRYLIGSGLLLAGTGLLSFRFLLGTPFRIDYPAETTPLPADLEKLRLRVRAHKGNIHIHNGPPGEIRFQTWIRGHALPNIQARRDLSVDPSVGSWELSYSVEPDGFFFEYQSHTYVYVPSGLDIEFDLFTRQGTIFRHDLPIER